MLKKIKYWLDTHTMNPLAWPYVLMESAHNKIEDALAQKLPQDDITNRNIVCPYCDFYEFTEQGLCEKCGNVVIY